MHYFRTLDEERLARLTYLFIFYFSAGSMLIITSYCILLSIEEYKASGEVIIGDVLVKTSFPAKWGLQLVTYIMIFAVISWFCITKIGGEKVSSIPNVYKSIFQVISLLIAVTTLYEFIYNLMVWNSFIVVSTSSGSFNLDRLSIAYPNPETPWNLVFSTKMTLAAFIVSSHAFYIITKGLTK